MPLVRFTYFFPEDVAAFLETIPKGQKTDLVKRAIKALPEFKAWDRKA